MLEKFPSFSAMSNEILCAVGTCIGMAGTIGNALTTNLTIKFWIFTVWAVSSVILIGWASSVKNRWFLIMEVVYLGLAFIGLFTHSPYMWG